MTTKNVLTEYTRIHVLSDVNSRWQPSVLAKAPVVEGGGCRATIYCPSTTLTSCWAGSLVGLYYNNLSDVCMCHFFMKNEQNINSRPSISHLRKVGVRWDIQSYLKFSVPSYPIRHFDTTSQNSHWSRRRWSKYFEQSKVYTFLLISTKTQIKQTMLLCKKFVALLKIKIYKSRPKLENLL